VPRGYTSLVIRKAIQQTLSFWNIHQSWTYGVSAVIGVIMLLYKPELSLATVVRLVEYSALSWGLGWTGSFVFNLIRAPKLLHVELSANLATVKAELHARSASLDLTILEGAFIDGPPLHLLLLIRAVNRGTRVTVRDWELLIEPSGFVHSPIPIREGLRLVRDDLLAEREIPEAIAVRLDHMTRSIPLETGVGVEGWLLFDVRGNLSLEQAMGSILTLKAEDDFGQTHMVKVRRRDYTPTTGTIS
jgi:hypothetical protein